MRQQRLDQIIESKPLLRHPFYLAWSAGTLTERDLGVYASQYGEFIDMVAAGWRGVGEKEIATEEQMHAGLWTQFAQSLGAPRPAADRLPEITELVELSDALFKSSSSSLGALYAFEQQQPGTALSKLQGLDRYYSLPSQARTYFEIHQYDDAEPRLLAAKIEELSPSDYDVAEDACRRMTNALWKALDGVMKCVDAQPPKSASF